MISDVGGPRVCSAYDVMCALVVDGDDHVCVYSFYNTCSDLCAVCVMCVHVCVVRRKCVHVYT